jgi:hypothetical protein
MAFHALWFSESVEFISGGVSDGYCNRKQVRREGREFFAGGGAAAGRVYAGGFE